MKVSISWLKELVDLNISVDELIHLLPLRSVSIKEITQDHIELDMKGYNRADLLSMRGVAQEVAAITGSNLAGAEPATYEVDLPRVKVSVEDAKLCPVYCIAAIQNLKVEESSETWVKKLSDCGIRSVNNIADVTNLIMLEYGQPMHAFDARGVKDETFIVRQAKNGERITTLDGKTRDLALADLLIADRLNALGIAGVMGGKDSEISDSTTTILLEAAIFDPVSIRKTSQRHGLPSEASKRFQHGLTKTNLLQALSAAIKMYESLGGKLTGITLVGNLEDKTKTIQLTQEKINSLLGVNIPADQVESSLKSLGFNLASHMSSGNVVWEVTVPYWRLDIQIEEDLIEEVARMYGYEKIPAKPLEGELPEKLDQSFYSFLYDLKKALSAAGLTEVQTYSFYSSKTINDLRLTINDLVKIANPISSETQYLRNNLWPNLVEVVAKNIRKGYQDIGIFEVGKVYLPQMGNLPKEPYRLAIALMNGSDNPMEELVVIARNVMTKQSTTMNKIATSANRRIRNDVEKGLFHPKRFATVEMDGRVIGSVTEVHPRFLNNFGIDKRVAILEISIDLLI